MALLFVTLFLALFGFSANINSLNDTLLASALKDSVTWPARANALEDGYTYFYCTSHSPHFNSSFFIFLDALNTPRWHDVINPYVARLKLTRQIVQGPIRCGVKSQNGTFIAVGRLEFDNKFHIVGTVYPKVVLTTPMGHSYLYCRSISPDPYSARQLVFLDEAGRFLPSTIVNKDTQRLTVTNSLSNILCINRYTNAVIDTSTVGLHMPFKVWHSKSKRAWDPSIDTRVNISECQLTATQFGCALLYDYEKQQVEGTVMTHEHSIIISRFNHIWEQSGPLVRVLEHTNPELFKIALNAKTLVISILFRALGSNWQQQFFYYDVLSKTTVEIVDDTIVGV